MEAAIHYEVKGKIILDFPTKNFQTLQKKFEHSSPIVARKEAFNFYQNYIEVLLSYQEKEYESHVSLKDELFAFFHTSTPYQALNEGERSELYGCGIGVYLAIDRPITDDEVSGTKWCLHGVGSLSGKWNDDLFIVGLTTEHAYYEYYHYDKGSAEIIARYYNEEAEKVEAYPILQTPYNWEWEGYDQLAKTIHKKD